MEPADFFQSTSQLVEEIVRKKSSLQLDLEIEKKELSVLYGKIRSAAGNVDKTLQKHVEALQTGAQKKIDQLEKKMLKAEKKKFEVQQRQVEKIKSILFPNESLQERVDNIMPYYAVYGKDFIEMLYKNSAGLKQEFCILTEVGE